MSTLNSLVQHSSGSVLPWVTRREKEIKGIRLKEEMKLHCHIRLRQDLYETIKTPPITTIKTNKLSNIARYEPSEREQNSPIYKCTPPKKYWNKFNRGAETHVQSWAPRHRVWVQIPAHLLTCSVTPGKSHNDLSLNMFNCKTDTNPVSPPRAVKLQGNAYLGPGVGVSPGASPCMKLL